jgi:hypothetical protein
MGVYTRPDSPWYWLWLEGARLKEKTRIPVLRQGPAKQQRAARRLAEERYASRMLEVAEQEITSTSRAPAAGTETRR